MKIVLGVAGGIAAYKSCHIVRKLREQGHSVRVVPTTNALKFVGAATWEALSGQPVASDVFSHVDEVEHVKVGDEADLVIVAPATADVLSRAASGSAGDMLTATLLVATCPVIFAPAMHTQMWNHPATRANVSTLREYGFHVMEPASGRLTGEDSGPGRLPEPKDIVDFALRVAVPDSQPAETSGALFGARVVVTAGGTREPLDPVRFIGNHSSGKQGVALAKAAAQMGAHVDLLAANVNPELLRGLPSGVNVVQVETTEQLRQATHLAANGAQLVIMAAAVADYRPESVAEHKMKKTDQNGLVLELVQNPDILRELVDARRAKSVNQQGDGSSLAQSLEPVIIGFAAETGDAKRSPEEFAREKLIRKGCDAIVFNSVAQGATFGADDTEVTVLAVDHNSDHPDADSVVKLAHARGSKESVSLGVMKTFADMLDR